MNKCNNPKAWHDGDCCCNCQNHIQDFHHCTTKKDDSCTCSEPKGWICIVTIGGVTRAHSGWSEHGFCELHTPKENETEKSRNTKNDKL